MLGGMSFLSPEKIVAKLQKILQNSAGAAFDLALNTMCEPCAKTMKSMEAITDALNSLQLDDCKAGKVVAANFLSEIDPTNQALKKAAAEKEFLVTKGLQDLPSKMDEIWRSKDNESTTPTSSMIAGCPPKYVELFGTPGSILESVALQAGYPKEHIDIIRGYIGDINVYQDSQGQLIPLYVPPCKENSVHNLNDFLQGEAYKKDTNWNCTKTTDAKANLLQWTLQTIIKVNDKMKNKEALLTDEAALLNKSPVPIFAALKASMSGGDPNATAVTLSDVIARAYAYNMMADMFNMYLKTAHIILEARSKMGQSQKADCQIDLLNFQANTFIEKASEVKGMLDSLRAEYAKTAKEVTMIQNLIMNFKRFEDIARERLSKHFGSSIANRALGN